MRRLPDAGVRAFSPFPQYFIFDITLTMSTSGTAPRSARWWRRRADSHALERALAMRTDCRMAQRNRLRRHRWTIDDGPQLLYGAFPGDAQPMYEFGGGCLTICDEFTDGRPGLFEDG